MRYLYCCEITFSH